MTEVEIKDNQFGSIAVEMNFVNQEKIDKALVVQARIFEKAKVSMPIGEILIEMGALSAAQRDEILRMQTEIAGAHHSSPQARRPARSVKKEAGSLDINVSRDKLKATIYYDGQIPTTDFDVNDVKLMLHAEGILHGIVEESRIEGFLKGEFSAGEPWIIASGTEPIADEPPQFVYHFDTDPLKIGTLTESGLMDWKDRGELPQVAEGDLLAEKIPGSPGREGMDVYGKKIPIPKQREQRFKCGKGARRSDDGNAVHATVSGIPRLSVGGEISVMSTLAIQGDISLETGHVTFDGHIEVAGAVQKGYRVKGESLRANEIHDAEIDISGDVTVMNGIYGTTLRCGGNLRAGHLHNTTAVLDGDIAVEKEIIESKIEANGRCLINDGIILASTLSAKMGLTAMDIGTEASHPSELTVGIDQKLERTIDETKARLQALKTERETLPKLLVDLKKRSDQINTRLGEVAQEQDRCMVQHRRLQEKIEAGLMKATGAEAQKVQQTLLELKARQDAYDQDVAGLMEEDESISEQIAKTQTAIAEGAQTLEQLTRHLEELNEAKKTDLGRAVVKIGGNVYSGTKINGPHSTLVVQENLQRLTISETDKPDHDGVKRWRFEMNPYR